MTNLLYGVGYNSKGVHKTKINGTITIAYNKWRRMIERCYSAKCQTRNPTYIGCTVDKEWHDFQNFAEWFYCQDYSDLNYQLDKDLLDHESKVYSPKTCCLVPIELNALLTSNDANRGELPQGASLHRGTGKYRSTISINNKHMYLGLYDTPEEAHQAYKVAKEANVKDMAVKWRDKIADSVFNALMTWSL